MEEQLPQLLTQLANSTESWEQVHQKITKIIAEMQQNRFEALLQLLYRLDVSEQKVKQKTSEVPPELWAETVATLIMEREQERMYWRNKYKNLEND